jgi:hypothetical protein
MAAPSVIVDKGKGPEEIALITGSEAICGGL